MSLSRILYSRLDLDLYLSLLILINLSVCGETQAWRIEVYFGNPKLNTIDNYGNDTGITTTTAFPYVPVKPAKKVRYNLTLTNPGPSVLDSTLFFQAELAREDGSEIPQNMNFSFLWMNMADMMPRRTDDHDKAVIPLTFSSENTSPGDYTMTVVASEENMPSKILAFETKKFVLTENLNGHLTIHQDLEYQRLNNTFATGQSIKATAVLLDHFQAELRPHFTFFWSEGDKHIVTTQLPEVETTIDKPSNFSLNTLILATMALGGEPEWESGPGQNLGSVKDGKFEKKVVFKDPLSDCFIDRVDTQPTDRDIKIGSPALINITCIGSAPTAVCVNITSFNLTTLNASDACQPQVFVHTLHHQVEVNLNKTGWNDVHFFVFNDVTRRQYTVAYYAYDPTSTNIPALVLPVVFVVLGIVVVSVGGVYIMRLRKKPLVEVADFDFHPELNEPTSGSGASSGLKLSLVANSIKYLLTRRRWGDNHRRPTVGVTSQREMEESASSLKSSDGSLLYDSL